MMQRHHITAVIILGIMALAGGLASADFLDMYRPIDVYPSSGLTGIGNLSDYLPSIKGTQADTKIYFFDSGHPGGTALLLGGTHPNEPAAFLAAVMVLENVMIDKGRILVIPQACRSGFTCTDPFEAYPQDYTITTPTGPRRFPFGSRVANPLDQWPDPLVYSHYPSGQRLSGFETRNLNRSYPGRPNGTFSEKLGYAIIRLIEMENVDIAFDLHEAAPEIPIINAIVYHEKGEDIALSAVLELEFEGLRYSPEMSPINFRGLSHREWGDHTKAIPFLMETSNVIQGRLRGKTNTDLIIKGESPRYREALESGALRIEYDPDGQPVEMRVGRHVQGFRALISAYNEYYPEKPVEIKNLPSFSEMMEKGVGYYLSEKK
nr:succinylglutamate desuccinylase/aspartoacylase family protein [candidate division Zixibacteria bacterium]